MAFPCFLLLRWGVLLHLLTVLARPEDLRKAEPSHSKSPRADSSLAWPEVAGGLVRMGGGAEGVRE